jgi:hypothetical protein
MLTTDLENEILTDDNFSIANSWGPEDESWDDEEDDDFEDELEDLDDLHEIEIEDEDFEEPPLDDDDHLPEEEDE